MIPHSKPTISKDDINAVVEVIKSGHLVQGIYVKRFEEAMVHLIGLPEGAAVSSGTAALHLALVALNIKKNDKVIIPSFVCSALLNAVNYMGAVPIIVDIDPETFNIDVKDLKGKIDKGVRAIIVPHLFGLPADIDQIMSLNIPVIEDCAQALGATYKGRPVGSFGDISIFSFYATKVICSGEGGMVLAKSKKAIERIKDLRDYDNKPDYKMRFNYKMTDIQAALGLSQLKRLKTFIDKRKKLAEFYDKNLDSPSIIKPIGTPKCEHIFYRYVIKIKKNVDKFIDGLDGNINCRRPVYKPLHQYLNLSGFSGTEEAYRTAISIPLYPQLRETEAQKIVSSIKKELENSSSKKL